MKFLADDMLGKLTRWLRMLGHDVKYTNGLADKTLITIAKSEKRVLLTRDVKLHRLSIRKCADSYLVEGKNETERLAALSKRFDMKLELNPSFSRCPKCNARIEPARKDEISDKIPSGTAAFYEEFWACPRCGKVYWQGAHWKRITGTLNKAREMLNE